MMMDDSGVADLDEQLRREQHKQRVETFKDLLYCGVTDKDMAWELSLVEDPLPYYINNLWDSSILLRVPSPQMPLEGMVNAGNTCYLDSVLFAMFARTHVFDPLLKVVTPDPKKRQVQLAIHYIVNQLRMGNISGAAVMRHAIVQLSACCDFPAADRIFEQQDASELFVILMDLLGAPLVPLYAHIYHGGKSSHSDEGVVTERIFPLDITHGGSTEPVRLETLLSDYFHAQSVLGLRREVTPGNEQRLDALRSVAMLPFYAVTETSQNSSLPVLEQVVLPIVLKRTAYDHETGELYRVNRRVSIPTEIDFSTFVSSGSSASSSASSSSAASPSDNPAFKLQLLSAVCHEGASATSGHYIAFAKDIDGWIRYDDSYQPRVLRLSGAQAQHVFETFLPSNAFILFYALQKGKVAAPHGESFGAVASVPTSRQAPSKKHWFITWLLSF